MGIISHMSVDFPEKRQKEEKDKKNNSCSRFILFSVHLHSLFGSVSSLTCIRSFKEMHANYHLGVKIGCILPIAIVYCYLEYRYLKNLKLFVRLEQNNYFRL